LSRGKAKRVANSPMVDDFGCLVSTYGLKSNPIQSDEKMDGRKKR
jgi:hypothetical protein